MQAEYATDTPAKMYNGTLRVVRRGAGTDENKGDYEDALTITKAEAGGVWDNYDVTPVAGDFHITGGKLYITALKQSKNYGEADPDWTAVEEKEGAVNPNYRVDGISAPDVVTGVTLSCTHDEAVGTYTINIAATGVPTGYEDVVYIPATFKINKRPLAVVANVQTLKIGDTADDLDQNAYAITTTAATEGLIEGDLASEVFSLTTANPLNVAGKFAGAITKVDGTKAGNYEIAFTAGTLIVIDPASTVVLNRPAKAAYTADPTLDNAAAVIAAAAGATYTAAEAGTANTFLTGAWAYGTVKTAGTPAVNYTEGSANTYNAANVDGCVPTGFVPSTTSDPTLATISVIVVTAADGVALTENEAYMYNSTIGGAKTTADIETPAVADVLYTDDEVNEHNATLPGAVAAGDTKKMAVTFGDFNMIAEKWYPIVLPFATTVKEISETFGYAIVNILKEDNTNAKKIAFKLHMGAIPANTPFVVKIYEDMNMNGAVFGDPLNIANTGKTIVNSAAPEVADASGVKFIGSYSAKTDGFKANEAFFSVSAEKNDYYWGPSSAYMAPLAAYFQIPEGAAARVIEFEEADGTTTAINFATFSNDVEKMNAEGWYTIGGQKLNGAPTQKGLYINNGKKVIIK
jgi:hypothetical protein